MNINAAEKAAYRYVGGICFKFDFPFACSRAPPLWGPCPEIFESQYGDQQPDGIFSSGSEKQ